MITFHAIAAMSENRCIGALGKMPWHLPEDFAWFKHKTMGGTLIMGRKTFKSIGKPLPGRETVVISHSPVKDITTCTDLAQLETILNPLPKPYWVCGGVEIYRQLLRNSDLLYLTRVKRVVSGDAFFPPFEDKFELDQEIHENDQFKVERWRRLFHHEVAPLAPEPWPEAPVNLTFE
jgi:dihydrofolate reductase